MKGSGKMVLLESLACNGSELLKIRHLFFGGAKDE